MKGLALVLLLLTVTAATITVNTAADNATPAVAAVPYPMYTPSKTCVGDCNGDAQVTIEDLLAMVDIALGNIDCSVCVPCFSPNCTIPTDGVICPVTIDEIITGVNNALNGCQFD